jgi:hypothetical protein
MTIDEKTALRTEALAVLNPRVQEVIPLPAQTNRAAMTPAQIEEAHSNWVDWIYARPSTSWQADEIEAVRFTARRVIATL